jgi:steroid 5-alpha reductase family enzyme
MTAIIQTMTISASAVAVAMFVLWIIGTIRRDVSIVDLFWGTGFVLVAWIGQWVNGPAVSRVWWVTVLATLWGLRLSLFLAWRVRLSLFLAWRNAGQAEDRRYTAMRVMHGGRFWWVSLWIVFFLQGAILWFVALPLQIAAARNSSTPLGWIDALGFLLWLAGFIFESVGDWQLARFKANPDNAGRVMDRGLWRYTRHPNYFGDFCVWWGLYLIAAAGGAWWTIASPLLMTTLLMRVSGVTLLERSIVERRPEYAAYQARTNSFFPGPPKELAAHASQDGCSCGLSASRIPNESGQGPR